MAIKLQGMSVEEVEAMPPEALAEFIAKDCVVAAMSEAHTPEQGSVFYIAASIAIAAHALCRIATVCEDDDMPDLGTEDARRPPGTH